jgi:hypothetical protein
VVGANGHPPRAVGASKQRASTLLSVNAALSTGWTGAGSGEPDPVEAGGVEVEAGGGDVEVGVVVAGGGLTTVVTVAGHQGELEPLCEWAA